MEIFVVPYLLWFFFIGGFGIYFFFFEEETFCKMMYLGMIGMTLFLIVSFLYPNGLMLRPDSFERNNIFVELVKIVYKNDTSTNVLPSIHVYNSLGVVFATKQSKTLKNKKIIQFFSVLLCFLIILSTMFIKQHSIIDVMFGVVLSIIVSCLMRSDDSEIKNI